MEIVSDVDKLESIKSMQSTIDKLENGLAKMTQKDAYGLRFTEGSGVKDEIISLRYYSGGASSYRWS